ncbi:MAG: dihydroneopterin aldolase, partial [Paludibacteraceae bacterium]|nr:dihydroneopterin aldolase [Paludibacteraceae bacterium]
MATITLEEMQFYAHHGCFEEERKVGTNFSVTVTFSYDATIAATTDSI